VTGRPTIDASRLPAAVRDTRSESWWGNALFMCIETSTVCLLLASYFYLWRNYPQSHWPPPRVDQEPTIFKPVPDLLYGTLNAVLLLASVPLTAWVYRLCGRRFDELERLNVAKPEEAPPDDRPPARPAGLLLGLAALTALSVLACVLRWYEFPALQVRWNENAYASLVWTLLGVHFLYVFIEAIEFAVLLLWTALYGFGENAAGDVILSAEYWYWTVAVGLVIYGVVYWFPRVV
jgi:cytochrome c oxidase subunit 3